MVRVSSASDCVRPHPLTASRCSGVSATSFNGVIEVWTPIMADRPIRTSIIYSYTSKWQSSSLLITSEISWIECQLRLGKGENVTSARWQVTLCDSIWHARTSRSGVAMYTASCYTRLLHFTLRASVTNSVASLPVVLATTIQFQFAKKIITIVVVIVIIGGI